MAAVNGDPAETSSPQGAGNRLDSWKDIAAYLKRSVPTVQRWEREEELPVHRLLHKKQGSIYAYASELDEWWKQRQVRLQSAETPATAVAPEGSSRRLTLPRRPVLLTTLGIALLSAASFLLLRSPRSSASPTPGRLMVAVLPFQNLGGGAEQDYVCDGLTEDLITELAVINPERLGVIARTSAMTYKGGGKTVRAVGEELGVQYVVEGSVRFAAQESRITAQLIRVSDQSHLWAHTYQGTPQEMFKLEEEIAQTVAQEVNIQLAAGRRASASRGSDNAEANRLYLQGREFWNTRSRAGLERSIELYQQALQIDPNFARAYAGMADSFNMLGYFGFRPLGYVVPKAQETAQRALALDDGLAQAHAALGFINLMWTWDWQESESELRRAIQLDPNYVPAHHFYALFLASAGDVRGAEEQIAVAQRLDPLSPAVNAGYAYVLFFGRQYERSLEYCRRALQVDGNYAVGHAIRGWDLVELKRADEGVAALERAKQLAPENSLYLATLARAHILAGHKAEAGRILQQLDEMAKRQWVGGSMHAIISAAQGDADGAFRWLDTARQQEDGFLLWAKVTPEFDPLRSDPRYGRFLQALQLH